MVFGAALRVFVQTAPLFALISWREEEGGGGGRVFSRKQGKIIMIPRVLQAGTQQSARLSRLPLSPRILQLSVESPKMFSTAYQPREAIPA